MNAADILPDFRGRAVHDFWDSYLKYDCEHAFCNAHLLRELIFLWEEQDQKWAKTMIDHPWPSSGRLLAIKAAVDAARNAGLAALPAADLDRFRDHPDGILAFMRDFSVPFDLPAPRLRQAGSNLDDIVVQAVDLAAQAPLKLLNRNHCGAFGLRADEIHNCFSLKEIYSSVQEGSLGELTRLGQPCPAVDHGFQDSPGRDRSPVTLDLNHILTRIAVRYPVDQDDDLVHMRISAASAFRGGVHKASDERVGGTAGGERVHALDDSVGHFETTGARHADNRDGALARRGGDGRDGVVE